MNSKNDQFFGLTVAWLALVALTLAGLGLNTWFRDAPWLPLLVAAIIWTKGTLGARWIDFLKERYGQPGFWQRNGG